MMKLLWAAILAVAVTPFIFFAYDHWQEQKELEKADYAVHQYIKAMAEGSDKALRPVLVKKEQPLLDDTYHAFPGNAKKMGNRYAMKRFSNDFDKGELYYYIEYYHPANNEVYADNLKMVKDSDGKWKSTSLTGILEDTMRYYIKGHEKEGVLVHSYKREGVIVEN